MTTLESLPTASKSLSSFGSIVFVSASYPRIDWLSLIFQPTGALGISVTSALVVSLKSFLYCRRIAASLFSTTSPFELM